MPPNCSLTYDGWPGTPAATATAPTANPAIAEVVPLAATATVGDACHNRWHPTARKRHVILLHMISLPLLPVTAPPVIEPVKVLFELFGMRFGS